MMKTSKISIFKDHCKHIVGLCSSTIIIATKPAHDKLPLSTISYPYQQLVAILTKKTEAGIFKNFIAIAFKKISYPLSTISYPYQQLVTPHPHLVTLHPHLVTLLSTFSYTCYSKTPTTIGKTYFLLKLLKTLYKNRLKVRGCYE